MSRISGQLWSVDVPWACFGVIADRGVVVEVAPIAHWAMGKPVDEVLMYFLRRGGKVVYCMHLNGFVVMSGGQTGADRGGLDAAIEMDVPHRGWVPRGRRAEDGRVPDHYNLQECQEARYDYRTELNVADSQATVIFTYGPLLSGSLQTQQLTLKHRKPCLWIDFTSPGDHVSQLVQFIQGHNIRELNVAGNRESKAPGIQQLVKHTMMRVLGRLT